MTRILALDLSIAATGIAMPDGDLDTYTSHATGDWRIHNIATVLAANYVLVDGGRPHLVAMEDCLVRTPAAAALGMLHGAVRHELMRHAVPYMVVSPATLKVYGTGRGNATKADMRVALLVRTGIDERDDNRVDAAWLRYLALDLAGEPALTLPQTHRRALDKLTLPIGATA